MSEPDVSHAVGDARKRLLDLPPNHDEIHGHVDIDWPSNIERGDN